MITPDTKWLVIDAYLLGRLDEAGRAEVIQKLETDAEFRADMAVQLALHQHIDQQQRLADEALVDQFMVNEPPLDTDRPAVHVGQPQPVPFWRRSWARAAAALLLLVGLAWVGYSYLNPPPSTLVTTITYQQRGFGATGTPNEYRKTTYPLTLIVDGTSPGEYSTDGTSLTLFLSETLTDLRQWALRDDAETGGFQLITTQDQAYLIDRNTYGKRIRLGQKK